MLKLWATSLILEAVLATRMGGFPAFRRFLWYDVLTQSLGIACSGSGAWYPLVHRWSEVGAVVLLGFVVMEATCKERLQVDQGRSPDTGRSLAFCTAVAIGIHLMFAESVPWSIWASGVWQLVALSHSIMGLFVASNPTHRNLFRGQAPNALFAAFAHAPLLAFWLLADAALFYVAPHYPVGMAVLWLNAGTWAVWILAVGPNGTKGIVQLFFGLRKFYF